MKKTLCALGLLLASSCLATAQTEKGTKAIGGGISTTRLINYYNDSKPTSIYFIPSAEYFIANNLAMRAEFGIGRSTQKNEYFFNYLGDTSRVSSSESISLSTGVFIRKYTPIISKKLDWFVEAGTKYIYSKYGYENIGSTGKHSQKSNTYSAGIYAGLIYYFSPKISIESTFLNLNYSHTITRDKSPDASSHLRTNSFGLRLMSSLNLSLKYRLK